MRKLKLILLLILSLIIILVFYNSRRENGDIDNTEIDVDLIKENKATVINNGGNVLEYDGFIYYINTKRISRRSF